MTESVRDQLLAGYEDFTVSERMIAGWLVENLDRVPFETAASVGTRLGVSAMTVGRFLKARGWNGMAALKAMLREERAAPWLLSRPESRDARLQAELAAISDVYALAATPAWSEVVQLLARARAVHVTGFQTERGLAAAFADHLSYIRPAVCGHERGAGRFPAMLEELGCDDVLVLVDIRRYSRHFLQLGQRAAALGVPVVVITDPYCPWARDLTPHVLFAEVSLGHFWDMNTAMASLLNLLVDDVAREIGVSRVHERLSRIAGHYAEFIGFLPGGAGRQGV